MRLTCLSSAQALPAVHAAVPSALLLVVGQPHPVLGGRYLEQLQARARQLGLDDAVRFHASYLDEVDMQHLYQVHWLAKCS